MEDDSKQGDSGPQHGFFQILERAPIKNQSLEFGDTAMENNDLVGNAEYISLHMHALNNEVVIVVSEYFLGSTTT